MASCRDIQVAMLLVALLSSCGRIGYEERPTADAGRAPVVAETGGTRAIGGDQGSGGTDAGSIRSTGDASAGGAPGAAGARGDGGTDSGSPGSGGAPLDGGTGGIPTTGGTPNAGGSGPVADAGNVGCADGQREGFLDLLAYPDIAACDGGFAVPGVVGLVGPACGRAAGDDGGNSGGVGCNAEDLCSLGFHVCASAAEVSAKSSTGCTGAVVGTASVFYMTLQSGAGQGKCGPSGTDDVFGCGSLGFRPSVGCAPLDRGSGNLCSGLAAPWSCGTDQTGEALNVSKPGPLAGGVVCCRD